MQLRPELALFTEFMENKLKLNDHKGGWEKCSIEDLFSKLRREVDELQAAIRAEPSLNIAFEAADIANFAMMIAWNVMRDQFINSVQHTEEEPSQFGPPDPSPLACDDCRLGKLPCGANCPDEKCINHIPF